MRNPDGIRAESEGTPSASRAGALHSHIHIHSHRQESGRQPASIVALLRRERLTMDGRSAASIGGGC